MKRLGACVCVAAFLVSAVLPAVLGSAAGPRNPGANVGLTANDIKLRVGGVEVSEVITGDAVTINLTIRNGGDIDSSKVNVTILYDASNTFIHSADLPVAVPPGGFVYYETVWSTAGVALGDHTINVTLVELVSGDDDTGNNQAFKPITIRPVPRPHVFVDSIEMKTSALVGQNISIKANLKNDGTKDSDSGDTVKFMVGTQLLPGGTIGFQAIPPDNTTVLAVYYDWDTNNMQAGQFIIKVEVTSSLFKAEAAPITLSFPMPNVYVYRVDIDKNKILQGETVLITGKLRNNGTKLADAEEVWFLVDRATSPTAANYTREYKVPMNEQDVNFQFQWNSTDAAPGLHNFTIKVPGSSDVRSQLTTPNVEVIARTPVVNMTEFTVKPGTVKSGEPLVLSAKLVNIGSADAYNQEVRFYLGSTETYPIAIKKVNVRTDAPSWANFTYSPETGENDTTMNFFAVFVNPLYQDEKLSGSAKVLTTVPQRPDLVVTSVDVVRSMLVDNEYSVTAVISNNGKAPALNFTVKFNLGSELPFLIRGLDLANGQSMTVNWTVRPTMTGTNLRLKVEVNAEHSATAVESDEFNNIFESIQDISVRPQPKATIEIQTATPNKKSFKVHVGDKAGVSITVSLKNSGEKDGTVMVTLKEGLVVVATENVTVPANTTREYKYKWNITAAGTHTAKVLIEGADAGLITSQITSVDLAEERLWYEPGFELLVVVAVLGFFIILAGRRRR
jgi:hypothetical protein